MTDLGFLRLQLFHLPDSTKSVSAGSDFLWKVMFVCHWMNLPVGRHRMAVFSTANFGSICWPFYLIGAKLRAILWCKGWLLLMLMDPHPSQQHAGLHHAFWQLQQEATRLNARFEPASPKKSGVDGGANRCQHILVSHFTCTPHGDLVWLLYF